MPAAGGIHIEAIVLRRFADQTAARVLAVKIGGRPDTIDNSWGHSMLLNVALGLIVVAIFALIPLGCMLTRTKSPGPPPAS